MRIPTLIANIPVNNLYRNLLRTEGSITGTVPPVQVPVAPDNDGWVGLSQGTYLNNIRNGDTGAKLLSLPLVADLDNSGAPDAEPIELIRRPGQGSNENAGTTAQRNVYSQRFFALASVRILLSDTAAEITSLPTVTATRRWRSARSPAPCPLPTTHPSPPLRRCPDRRSGLRTGQERLLGQPVGSCPDTSTRAITTTRCWEGSSRSRSKGSRCGPGTDRGRVAGRDR